MQESRWVFEWADCCYWADFSAESDGFHDRGYIDVRGILIDFQLCYAHVLSWLWGVQRRTERNKAVEGADAAGCEAGHFNNNISWKWGCGKPGKFGREGWESGEFGVREHTEDDTDVNKQKHAWW